VRISTALEFTEDIELNGKRVLKGQMFMINIAYLQNNPAQWINPDTYIPERFDPRSEYYLTPSGKRRHPMSFGPFLGGKRICIGKTFAENIGKCIVGVIMPQLSFDITDPRHKVFKPRNTFHDSH
jgi:cytochrome P450